MEDIHSKSDCYISFSSSEGVGMGAVEAAIRDKPVIITDYGGAKEYINTPYTIECDLQKIPRDDFLYEAGMQWGKPNVDQLMEFMNDAYNKKLRYMDHSKTRNLTCKENILQEFVVNIIRDKNDKSGQNSSGSK